jgi:hypothetical protein
MRAFATTLPAAGYTEIARRWNAMGLMPHSKQGQTLFTGEAALAEAVAGVLGVI